MFSDYGFVSRQDQLTRRFMAFGGRIQAGVTRHLMAKIRQQTGRPADALPCIQEAVAMAVIGFSVGALLINLTRDFFPRRVILLPQDGFALAVVVLVLCVLASGMGVRLALKIEPAVALGG